MGFGGSAISLKQIVENLSNYEPVVAFYAKKSNYFSDHFNGVNARFLSLKFTYKQKQTLKRGVERVTHNKSAIRAILRLFSYLSYFDDKITVYKLSQIIKKENVELMHINNGIDPIAVSAARQCGIPCVAHSRGHENIPPKQMNIDYISKLIAPTKKIARHNHTHINVPSDKIIVIHNSVDLEEFASDKERSRLRSHYGVSNSEILMGMFARVRPMKGQLVLAKAICQLKEKGYPVKCIFVGDASDYGDDYLNEIRGYINQRNQENAFIFAGYQSDTASHYLAVDVVVHPSISEEAFGRIIIEAWAAGKPIVASDIGASVELINHQETGLIVEKNNPDELAKALERLITDSQLTKEIAQAGARYSLNFGNDSLIKSVEAIYEEILFQS